MWKWIRGEKRPIWLSEETPFGPSVGLDDEAFDAKVAEVAQALEDLDKETPSGGLIDGPALAVVGEGGEREFVIPESQFPGGFGSLTHTGDIHVRSAEKETVQEIVRQIVNQMRSNRKIRTPIVTEEAVHAEMRRLETETFGPETERQRRYRIQSHLDAEIRKKEREIARLIDIRDWMLKHPDDDDGAAGVRVSA